MNTEQLIAIQVLIVLLLVIGMLGLLLFRQKKTIRKLQDILTQFRDDMSGHSLAQYLEEEIHVTTSHCSQSVVDLKPDLSPEDLAIALRFNALQYELALLQEKANTDLPWRDQMKQYEMLAKRIHDLIRARIDHATKTLNDVHNQELAAKDQNISELAGTRTQQTQQLKQLKPLQDFIGNVTEKAHTPQEMEQHLHRSLLALCENFPGTEKLREMVFLLHEAFNEIIATSGFSASASPPPQQKTARVDPGQNLDMLNNIINRQNDTIRTLRKQIDALENEMERQGLLESVGIMEETIGSTRNCVQQLDESLTLPPPQTPAPPAPQAASEDSEEMYRIIEQFTEESAVMVEKIYLLSNQNKQLMLENEQLMQSVQTSSNQADSLTTGLKLRLEKQSEEMLALQKNFKELEEKYLTLYSGQEAGLKK